MKLNQSVRRQLIFSNRQKDLDFINVLAEKSQRLKTLLRLPRFIIKR